jgi:hypothetical protein
MLLHTGGSWNIIQNMIKHKVVDNFYLHHRAVVVQGHNYMTHLLTCSYTVLLCSRCKIHRYVAVPHRKINFWYIGRNFLPGRKPAIGWNHLGMTKKVETHLFILYNWTHREKQNLGEIFLIYLVTWKGFGKMSYVRKCFFPYEEMCKFRVKTKEAVFRHDFSPYTFQITLSFLQICTLDTLTYNFLLM